MNPRTAFLAAAAAGAYFLVASCGGGSSDPSQPQPSSTDGSGNGSSDSGSGSSTSSTSSTSGAGSSSSTASSGSGSVSSEGGGTAISGSTCQPQTVVGGDLSVAQPGPVGVTLLSTGGENQYTFQFIYDNVFGIPTNNPQDKWGSVVPLPLPPGTSVGTSIQVQLQPFTGFVHGEQTPSTFPVGIPIELLLSRNDFNPPGPTNISTTACILKDIPRGCFPTASVTYGANNTATVTFFPTGGPAFSVGLTNVFGKGSPTGC